MRAIQLCLIICLCLHVQCDVDSTPPAIDIPTIGDERSPGKEKWVKLENYNLEIPDNIYVHGGEIEDWAWYSEVTWVAPVDLPSTQINGNSDMNVGAGDQSMTQLGENMDMKKAAGTAPMQSYGKDWASPMQSYGKDWASSMQSYGKDWASPMQSYGKDWASSMQSYGKDWASPMQSHGQDWASSTQFGGDIGMNVDVSAGSKGDIKQDNVDLGEIIKFLKLEYKMQEWVYSEQAWSTKSEGEIELCTMDTSSEAGSWAALVRELLAIPDGCLLTPGVKKTDSNIFTSGEYRKMFFDGSLDFQNKRRTFLDVKDMTGQKLLQGHIVIPKA